MSNVLRTAIAYRLDFREREDWVNARRKPIPVACPDCATEYHLFVTEDASGEDALKWVEALLEKLELQHPHHGNVIEF